MGESSSDEESILVTGGLGFIGAAYVEFLHDSNIDARIVILDAHSYAADVMRLPERVRSSPRVTVAIANLRDWGHTLNLLQKHAILDIVHFAAQSHVDTSFATPLAFCEDNFCATTALLECARRHSLLRRFVHISTDEVYGDSAQEHETAPFLEDAPLNPSNPYAASKAAAEIMVRTYGRCFGLPVVITRGNNVYGPGQHVEKLIPAVLRRLSAGQPARVQGDGKQQRCFLHVDDAARAVEKVRVQGQIQEVYNIASDEEHSVLQVVETAASLICPEKPWQDCVEFVSDRPYNDRRYLVDGGKLRSLGWEPTLKLAAGMALLAET